MGVDRTALVAVTRQRRNSGHPGKRVNMGQNRRNLMAAALAAATAIWLPSQGLWAQQPRRKDKSKGKGRSPGLWRPGAGRWPDDEVGTPYYVYDDEAHEFAPGGWMLTGDILLSQSVAFEKHPRRGQRCYRAEYQLRLDHPWMAVSFVPGGALEPIQKVNVFKELGARPGEPVALRFWARSPDGAIVRFKVGGLDEDTLKGVEPSPWLELGPEWQLYTFNLTGRDLTGVRGR